MDLEAKLAMTLGKLVDRDRSNPTISTSIKVEKLKQRGKYMEILAYLYMALSYAESRLGNLSCMGYPPEECSHQDLEYATSDRTSASNIAKSSCSFKAAKA